MIIIPPQYHQKVERTQVSSKDVHHEVDKDKKDKEKNKEENKREPEDKIELSKKALDESPSKTTKSPPDNPLIGHIDIDV